MKKYHGVEISFKCYTKLSTEEIMEKYLESTKYCHSLGNKNKIVRISLVLFILRLDLR